MKTRKPLLTVVMLIALVAIGAVWALARGAQSADVPGSARLVSGAVGLAQGQTARWNAFNGTGGICRAQLILFDSEGRVLMSSSEVIPPDKTVSTEFKWPCCGDVIRVHGECGQLILKGKGRSMALLQRSRSLITRRAEQG